MTAPERLIILMGLQSLLEQVRPMRGARRENQPPRRLWTQDVVVKAEVLRARMEQARALAPAAPGGVEIQQGVERLLTRATQAALWQDPHPSRWTNWWCGTLVEAAYESLHAAESLLVSLYDDDDVEAEVPDAVARVEAGVHRDDPRRLAVRSLVTMQPGPRKRAALRRAVAIGFESVDRRHAQVRSFRNIVLLTSALIAALMTAVGIVLTMSPEAVPLCFKDAASPLACPSGGTGPGSLDIWVVMLLGLLGGALAAAFSIRTIRGTSTPYDVPVALACLKVPAGAATAVAALIFIRGEFVPGLSALDNQEQILAYALVFGYAQQLLTKLIDRQAQDVLNSVPSKESEGAAGSLTPSAWVVADGPPAEPARVEAAQATVVDLTREADRPAPVPSPV